MLEWYRAFADLQLIEAHLTGLLQHFVPDLEVITTSMAQLFRDSLRFDLRPDTTANELRALCQQSGVENSPSDSWDDLFHRLFLEKVEPILTAAGPKTAFIVKDFPPSQAALAKLTPDGFADRFELYWKGLEIANAYNELTDADEQLRRHQADQATRRELQRPDHPMDWNFIRALRRGVPPSGGIALGLDRLFMAVYDFSSIQQTRAFPMRHEVAGVNA
jgi:lysyl-tRNA synthetase class 2